MGITPTGSEIFIVATEDVFSALPFKPVIHKIVEDCFSDYSATDDKVIRAFQLYVVREPFQCKSEEDNYKLYKLYTSEKITSDGKAPKGVGKKILEVWLFDVLTKNVHQLKTNSDNGPVEFMNGNIDLTIISEDDENRPITSHRNITFCFVKTSN